ncbi:hypothetical protein F2981_13705 [Sinorhizobium meliloti]|nr:hypothetical protein [Sinorhizobium meliloti]
MAFYTTALRGTIETPAAKPMRALSIAPTCVAAEPDQETDSPHKSEIGKSAALLPRIVSAFELSRR